MIIHLIENIDETYWWPAKSVPNICKYLTKNNIECCIWTTYNSDNEFNKIIQQNNIDTYKYKSHWPKILRYNSRLFLDLKKFIENQTWKVCINLHNLWNYPSFVVFRLKKIFWAKLRLIISPRWSLFKWSLSQKKILKKIIWNLFQKKLFQLADYIHITSNEEKNALIDLWFTKNLKLIPNWIDFEEFELLFDKQESKKNFVFDKNQKYILFMSRIHKKKWFDILIDNFIDLSKKYKNINLIIAWPIDDELYFNENIEKLIKNWLKHKYQYLWVLWWDERLKILRACDIFVLPSFSENFWNIIAESLASELLTIVSNNTPWQEINDIWGACVSIENIKISIEKYLNIDNTKSELIWKNLRNYVLKNFHFWELINEYIEMYYN